MTSVLPATSLSLNELSAFGAARSTIDGSPLTPEEAERIHAVWRACNYLALGMIYLQDNPLLREPLKPEHIKNRLLGHWGASLHQCDRVRQTDAPAVFGYGRGD